MTPELLQHQYPNGLVLLAEPMPHVQSAAFSFLIPAGAAFEPAELPGSASMLGEWLIRGAGERDSRDLLSALDELGVSHAEGAQTIHSCISAASLGRNLLPALAIFADVVRRPAFDDDEVDSIRALCLQSLRSLEDDPGSKAITELRRRHFADPWGRSPIGTVEGVTAAAPDDLRSLFRRSYRPDGAILGVAGAFDWEAVRDEVGRLFGDWDAGQPSPVLERPTGPARSHLGQETQQTQIALAFPSVPVNHPDYYRARAAAAILGGYTSARLFTEVREKRGLCYSVFASYEAFKDRAAVICYAGTAPERAQQTLDVTLEEIRRLASGGVDREELDMMRAGLKSALVMQQESSMSRSASLASDWYHLGRVRPIDEVAAALDALTPEQVGAFASGMDLDAMTILTLGPEPLQLG
ncbi:M16 family metallopeptidase [Tautonia plasticadhaerens]|uniref:Peptidase M16 inactive domain protein n=1 Tax=Tautonia plasticadhaerens TaxID=2527974 RepID=A0A518H028_9BACT|nr:pitrilysin family protein [Tautonia plasticadhaerens]QDV34182.1 Peptidase M16 inactive domain protein [Tautonia plasticadhaerens]